MTRYQDLRTNPGFAKLKQLSTSELSDLKRQRHLPEDYLDFLTEVGFGEVGNAVFQLYGGVVEVDDVYDSETARELAGVLLFGDDFQGYCFGFLVNEEWAVAEINPNDGSVDRVAGSFEEFARKHLL